MRVCIYHNQLFKISESFISNQAQGLRRYSPVYAGRKTFGTAPSGATVITLDGASRLSNARMLICREPLLAGQLGDAGIDLIHAHFGMSAIYAAPLAAKLKIPLITTLHGHDATRSDLSFVASGSPALLNYVMFRRELIERCDLFVCVSDYIRDAAIARGYPPEKLVTHYMGVDASKITYRGDGESDGTVVHVARLVEKKGTRFLIDAMARVKKARGSAKLVIVGDGPLRRKLEQQVERLGLVGDVEFRGALPHAETLDIIKTASVVAVPSVIASNGDAEGLGLINLEASAQGIPVVGFASGGIPEAVADGISGFLVPERDAEGLADRIVELLSDSAKRQVMGKAGRALVESRFSIAEQTAKLEQLYDRVMAQERPPTSP